MSVPFRGRVGEMFKTGLSDEEVKIGSRKCEHADDAEVVKEARGSRPPDRA